MPIPVGFYDTYVGGGPASIFPTLPQVMINSSYDTADATLTGTVREVGTGKTYTNFQTALNDANPGDVIELTANETFVAPNNGFVLKGKTQTGGNKWIVIRSSEWDNVSFPAEGTRITPASASLLPKLHSQDNQPALVTETGANGGLVAYYRLIGIEVSITSGAVGDAPGGRNALRGY